MKLHTYLRYLRSSMGNDHFKYHIKVTPKKFLHIFMFLFSSRSMYFIVENLNVLVPELLDKLKVVEEKKPVNNVTTNIMRIRELIAQARSVAKKVSSSF